MAIGRDHCSRQVEPSRQGDTVTDTTLTIRQADAHDGYAIHRLAAMDSAHAPSGEVIVAEVGGELWAAVEVDTGAAIADPFRPSGELVDLLRFHAEGERRERQTRRPRLTRLLARAA
jgi:hypothetical protein